MDLRTKLQLKVGSLRVVGAPADVDLAELPMSDQGPALLVFVRTAADLEPRLDEIVWSAAVDRLTWVAYPKAGRLGTDLNRDRLAEIVRGRGAQPVRQVAIDDTWSALRFRPA